MIQKIRTSKASKVIACYLAMMMIIEITQPLYIYALTEGPSQPEFNSFTPIGTSDMVDLTSGDFNYNIPIMDVGGYPINLSYNSGVTMDQEASWVGLGWNLDVGQINRNVRGLPDDFKGDVITTDNNLKTNVTVGVNPYINGQIIGALDNGPALSLGGGLDVQYNNYTGYSAIPSFGPSFKFSDYVSVGMQLSSSTDQGATITPSVSLSTRKLKEGELGELFSATLSPSISYNTRQGLTSFNLASSVGYQHHYNTTDKNGSTTYHSDDAKGSSGSGSISFLNNTFTPTKRLAFRNNNIRFSYSGGVDLWGGHVEVSIAGYGSVQKLVSKVQLQKSYGYENTDLGDDSALLDFNREKEQALVSQNTTVLPVTNYTYDIYTIQGQQTGGMFRPFRGQIGQVYDGRVEDESASNSAGLEIEGGAGAHKGLNFRTSNTISYTGKWNTTVSRYLQEKTTNNLTDYEKVYYKSIGESRVDPEYSSIIQSIGGIKPVTLKIDAGKNAVNIYRTKSIVGTQSLLADQTAFNSQIKRTVREKRNKVVQKVTKAEAQKYNLTPFFRYNYDIERYINGVGIPLVPGHHTAGYIVTDENGSKSIYGETVYNKLKKEVSFAVRGNSNEINNTNGLVKYGDADNSSSNAQGRDNYFNSVKTPPYAHTYLLSSVLSTDYSDLTGNGPTDDDLGNYTKFTYDKKLDYQWRIPFGEPMKTTGSAAKWASYNEGYKIDKYDQKASYLYGIKENKYLKKIETKTHVAFIDLELRKDGYGVTGENGGSHSVANSRMYCIKSIRLYSKPEAVLAHLMDTDPSNDDLVNYKPIKTAHFEYDYSLCPGIDNNVDGAGKLTLKKVYFTYKGSNMGKYTPYVFDYDAAIAAHNPSYNVKAYDIWGSYKPFVAGSWSIDSPNTTPQEFPYVDQSNRTLQDTYAAVWSLSSIQLPSGGKVQVQYEADDYKYVQNKRAMQMFKVHGVTNNVSTYTDTYANKNKLYYNTTNTAEEARYAVIKLPTYPTETTNDQIIRKYTDQLVGKSVYFNFLLNMTPNSTDYEYISGYFIMDESAQLSADRQFLFIPMKALNREGKLSGGANSNPISVAGWFFGRQNLNAQMNNTDDPVAATNVNVFEIGNKIWKNLKTMAEIFTGANGRLRDERIAQTFKSDKSWIRLVEPSGTKVGGGCRVKSVVLNDQWDTMVGASSTDDRYAKKYGQSYNYQLADGTSSGVATYEPNMSKENPLIMPLYSSPEKLTAQAYQEEPFGESFFPSPAVTYSRVSVSNISASNDPARKSGSGTVVTQHYTTKDFPTIAEYTNLAQSKKFNSNENSVIGNMLKGLLGMKINVNIDLTMSQGFVIETNDMNGKLKKQEVFNNANALISSVEYKYSTDALGKLNNVLPTIEKDGALSNTKEIGMQYDMINDLRESYSQTKSHGVAVNVDMIPLGFIPLIIGWGMPERSDHKQILRTAVTTKVIHRTGILKEKIAYDLGARVSTVNQAWDATTGQVILTETINEFEDKFYNFSYPSYWFYENMGMASGNIDIRGKFTQLGTENFFTMNGVSGTTITQYLKPGDELMMSQPGGTRFWVSGYNTAKTAVSLQRVNGTTATYLFSSGLANYYSSDFRIIRSGIRNQQMALMSNITLMASPIYLPGTITLRPNIKDSFTVDSKIINASAVEYSGTWASQCENGLPKANQTKVNKYLFNIEGMWRAVKSYAYLTGRLGSSSANTRKAGFFTTFTPFYKQNAVTGAWGIDYDYTIPANNKWTYASEVTKYNPYGVELENKDALGRYSSAQYGYQYKLPIAVASNSTYEEMGFDGFEDYNNQMTTKHIDFFQAANQAEVSKKAAHTGKRSMLVKSGNRATMVRRMVDCQD